MNFVFFWDNTPAQSKIYFFLINRLICLIEDSCADDDYRLLNRLGLLVMQY